MASRRSNVLQLLAATALFLIVAAGAGWWALYQALLADLPELRGLADYRPPLTSTVFDRNGRLIGEFYEERRRLVTAQDLPHKLVLAFVAGEDANFFAHKGLDYMGILRALWVNLRAGGHIRQGASTITQQTVKGLLLTPERKWGRKFKEMILARRIEERFSKEEILFLYLNQIYFGHGAYGVAEAARTYFDKDVSKLTLSEAALLAGLPQRPSDYSPRNNPEAAEMRRRYVLRRMFEEGFIAEGEYETTLAQPPELREPATWNTFAAAAYFTEEIRRYLTNRFSGERLRRGGLRIETTLDGELQQTAVRALRAGLEELDRRQGYRGPLRRAPRTDNERALAELAQKNALLPSAEDTTPETSAPPLPLQQPLWGLVTALDNEAQTATVAFSPDRAVTITLAAVNWAHPPDPNRYPYLVQRISDVFHIGDVARFEIRVRAPKAEGGAPEREVVLLQEPEVEGALLSLDIASGDVVAMVGGYDFERSEFNRVVQARRQPGSAFKPLIYAAALEQGYTAASVLVDRPVVYSDPASGFTWRPENYGRKFLGRLTLRESLARSVNNATIHLVKDIGVNNVIALARRAGIRAPLDPYLSLALGSSALSLLELTRAYAVFPRGGKPLQARFIRRVLDREGEVLLENGVLETETEAGSAVSARVPSVDAESSLPAGYVMRPEHAYVMTELLRAVVEDPQGTGRRARDLQRTVAGKTGTTNEQADAWFIGFSPDVLTGVWVGFDRKRVLGRGETGSRAALPIWMNYMQEALRQSPTREFAVPDGIVFARVDADTGLLADSNSRRSFLHAFVAGTEPTATTAESGGRQDEEKRLRLETF